MFFRPTFFLVSLCPLDNFLKHNEWTFLDRNAHLELSRLSEVSFFKGRAQSIHENVFFLVKQITFFEISKLL